MHLAHVISLVLRSILKYKAVDTNKDLILTLETDLVLPSNGFCGRHFIGNRCALFLIKAVL